MKKCLCGMATCLLMLPLVALGQTAGMQEKPLTAAEQMDKLFDFWNRLDQPGFAVVVVKEGQVLYQKVFGLACQEQAAAITPNSVFNTATLAQMFVGQAVAMLEKQGRLSLDDDVRKHIPELPDLGVPVLLRHLLFHSSGLRDWLAIVQLAGRDREEVTLEKVLNLIKLQKKPVFPPGERFGFSNTNYDLLAEVIRRAAGRPFSDWAWENMFRPMKMTRTQFRGNSRSIFDDEALSYNYTRQEYLRGIDNLSLAGSHSLFTSIADLAKWLVIVETGPPEYADIFAKMFKPAVLANGQPTGYGYGLNVGSRSGSRSVFQTGTWAGSGAHLLYLPDLKFGFAVLANWDYTPVTGFAGDIMDIYLPAPAPPPPPKKSPAPAAKKAVKVSPTKLDALVGDYRFGPGQVFSISRTGDQLFLVVPGQRLALTTLSETEFSLDFAGARIAFQKNKEGKAEGFVLSQGGGERVIPRVVLVKPTEKELGELAGTYFNDELNLRFSLELQGGGLVLIPPEQGEVRLAPDEKDHFTSDLRAIPMIVFQRDAQNRVSGFVIDNDPVRDLVFKKD